VPVNRVTNRPPTTPSSMTESNTTGSRLLPTHVEVFVSSITGEPIGVWCACAIGKLHTYAEWRERYEHEDPSKNHVVNPTVGKESTYR